MKGLGRRWVDGVKMGFSEAEFGGVHWIDPPLVVASYWFSGSVHLLVLLPHG